MVSVANVDLALKPGLTASTRIIVDQRSNVLRVPDQALRYAPGGITGAGTPATGAQAPTPKVSHVWVLRDGTPVSLVVVPGLDDDSFTEIVSGDLKAGDQVIVAASSTATVSSSAVPAPRL